MLTDGRTGIKALPELIMGDLPNPRGTGTFANFHPFHLLLPARLRDF